MRNGKQSSVEIGVNKYQNKRKKQQWLDSKSKCFNNKEISKDNLEMVLQHFNTILSRGEDRNFNMTAQLNKISHKDYEYRKDLQTVFSTTKTLPKKSTADQWDKYKPPTRVIIMISKDHSHRLLWIKNHSYK